MENIVTECEEIAWRISAPKDSTLDECLAIVRQQMPDETHTIVENVALEVWRKNLENATKAVTPR